MVARPDLTERAALSRSEDETESLGRALAKELALDDVVYLIGGLGCGKTALARGIAAGLGALPRQVASPTFALLHEYADASGRIVLRHLDLYRLEDRERDLAVLGLPQSVEGAPVAVEWPGVAIRALLPPTRTARIEALPDGTRRITLDLGRGGRYATGGRKVQNGGA